MAVRDTWNRALVYFGLAEDPEYRYDDDYDDYDPDTLAEGEAPPPRRQRERPQPASNVRRLRRDDHGEDDIDEIFADDPAPRRRRANIRPVSDAGADVQVHFVTPRNFNDAQEVADRFKRSVPVILNLQSTSADLSKRLIDFSSGLTYALDGGMQKIADKTFMLTPANVEVSAEEKARLVEKGFFNQS
ncbi:MAG: cell division protein SepF [Solirubrobacterales bacterium]|nr:cell division protein SepF [Solirubrobacterales bacterium]MCB8970186.1 cell division protein SepF [Thermoleophilales bacterium]MCO5328124.1 cell division protein SepF [Solirubrobacterales bacterium]